MTEDWSRPAPPARERARAKDTDPHRDPWSVRIVDDRRLRSSWSVTPFAGNGEHRLWRERGLVTIAGEDGTTTVEGVATGAAVVREWAPWGELALFTLLAVGLLNLIGDGGVYLESLTAVLCALPFVIGQLRMPFVRVELLDAEGRPRTVQLQPVPRRF